MSADTTDADGDPSRYCTRCGEHKSIRGVWYLVRAVAEADSAFHCESCFNVGRAASADASGPRPVVDPTRVPTGPGLVRSELTGRRGF